MGNSSTPQPSFHPARDILAGVLVAAVIITLVGSFGLLIFTGPLAPHAGLGIQFGLISACLLGGLCALFSRYHVLIAIPQDRIAPIIAFLAASVVAQLGAGASPEMQVGTVLVANLLATLITGFIVFALGRLRLANLIRFIPYPVIGGFLAGSGWLLATGSISAMTGQPFTWLTFIPLLTSGAMAPWLPSGLFGAALFFIGLRVRHWGVLPVFIMGGLLVFYASILVAGLDLDVIRERGWLFAGIGAADSLQLAEALRQTNWTALFFQTGSFAAIALTSVVSILLNCSAIELDSGQEADLNKELKTTGIANIATGAVGGMVGFASLSLTRLAREAGGVSRWTGVIAALVCGAFLLFGHGVIGYIPKFILGGLLFYLGLRFLHEWLIEARRRLPLSDYLAILIILVTIGTAGYLQGVLIGLITATVLFVVNYSRVHVVTHAVDGTQQQSNVDRPGTERHLLDREGETITILKLQGFIFFGSANTLLEDLRARLNNFDKPPLRFVILDFARVDGVDSSAALAMAKMRTLARDEGFVLILCKVTPELERQLVRSGYDMTQGDFFRIERDRDHALEWCEDQILDRHGARTSTASMNLEELFREHWPADESPFAHLMDYLENEEPPEGDYLMLQGDESDDLIFIARGKVSAYLELQNGRVARLRTMGAGTVVGELGLYLDANRTASIVTESNCQVYRLTRNNLTRMREENPALASTFHHFMMRMVAVRLVSTSRTLQAILE